jgi:glycerol kinase
MAPEYVAAVDQGTTGTRAALFDRAGAVVADAYERHEQRYPEPGWVEHDPVELVENAKATLLRALERAGVDADALAALGVTNQRETTVLWEAATGDPVHDAVVWQDRRTTERVESLVEAGASGRIRETTGLRPDAYFSATKAEWLLDHAGERGPTSTADLRERAAAGELRVGTVDSWLLDRLTGVHATDVTNASRTMLFDIHDLAWDDDLLAEFGVPEAALPAVHASSDATAYGRTDPDGFLGASVPVTAALGDQQAALVGQACFDAGDVKTTYGTGAFLLMNTGTEPVDSDRGLLTTVAFQRAGEAPRYALEGSVFAAGAAVEWLRDVGLLDDPADVERLARGVDGTDGVFFVPAFSGLGAPHWDGRARGTLVGLTRGTERGHLARAALEAVAYRTRDLVEAMAADSGLGVPELRVDGGAADNDLLCGIQADVLDADVVRPPVEEATALGAAYAAGLAVGYWESVADLRERRRVGRRFSPAECYDRRYERWGEAVDRSRNWAER